jgi:putative ABC transport system substrate-binding protein
MRRREFIAGLGGTAASSNIWPLVARAQQPARPVIGVLFGVSENRVSGSLFDAIRQGLSEQGYVEGRNIEILYRSAEGEYDQLPVLAGDLVRRRVAVIAGGGTSAALAAKSATATIPIVFSIGTDPVEVGLVASLNRPGGNLTGVSFLAAGLVVKRIQLLHAVVPAATSIAFLVDPSSRQIDADIREAQDAAHVLGVRLVILNTSTASEIEAALRTVAEQRIGALLTASNALFAVRGAQLIALAARHAVPAIYHVRGTVDAGGLMSYGASISDANRLAGTYVGRILKGEKPAELPVQFPTKFELILNLKTAKALGLTIPETLLATADEVIQ